MHDAAVEMIGHHRATGATFLPVWPEHKMIDEQLRAPVKEVGKRFLALRAVKDVVLFDFDPRLLAALYAEIVLESRKLLLLFKELFARIHPLVS